MLEISRQDRDLFKAHLPIKGKCGLIIRDHIKRYHFDTRFKIIFCQL